MLAREHHHQLTANFFWKLEGNFSPLGVSFWKKSPIKLCVQEQLALT